MTEHSYGEKGLTASPCLRSLRGALLAFSAAFNTTPGGDGWSQNSTTLVCDWNGITCVPGLVDGSQTFSIDLSGQSLGGTPCQAGHAMLHLLLVLHLLLLAPVRMSLKLCLRQASSLAHGARLAASQSAC